MPQATIQCPTSLHLCRIRVTRLNADGTLATGPKNSYVSASLSHLNWTSVVDEGEDTVVIGGCACIAVQRKDPDLFRRFTFELEMTEWEFPLMEMMCGASAVLDNSTIPVPIGNQWPSTLQCGQTQPAVAIEAWADAWDNDTQLPPPYRYMRYLWTMSYWQIGNGSLQNDFVLPVLNGFSRTNPAWGLGPYNDQKYSLGSNGGVLLSDVIPVATCDYQVASSAT